MKIPKSKTFSMEPLIKLQNLQPSALDRRSSKTMVLEIMPQKPLDYQPVRNTRESPLKRIAQTTLLAKNLWQTSTKPDYNNVCSTTTSATISNLDVLMEKEDSEDQTEAIPDSTQGLSVGIFTREGTAMGTDLFSKMIITDIQTINMTIKAFVAEVAEDHYVATSTEFINKNKCNILYAPHDPLSTFPSVLIEV